MRFASCRIQKDRIIVCGYDKEYNRAVARRFTVLPFEEAAAGLAAYEYLDIVVPAAEMLRLSGSYPAVRRSDFEKIVRQDIETATPFKGDEVVFDTGPTLPDGAVPVHICSVERIRDILGRPGIPLSDKVRTLVPETALAPCEEEDAQAIFLDDDTVVLADVRGQVVRTGGIGRLVARMREALGHGRDEEEALQVLASSRDLSDPPALSEDELLLRKAAERFFRSLIADFGPYIRRGVPTTLFVADRLPGNAEKIFPAVLPGSTVVPADACLDRVSALADAHEGPDLARGPFTYLGGMAFLKRRLLLIAALFVAGFVLMAVAFEVRLWRLDRSLDAFDEKGRAVTKEILGKEYPSLRQALSTMTKTIEGKSDAKGEKKLYPYSAVFVMEQVFPAAVFDGSSIEVRDFSFKDGKVRFSGEADSLEHINTMLENLEELEYTTDLNKGQITSRGGKSSFSVGFSFQKRSAKEQARKEAKKETKKDTATAEETTAETGTPAPAVSPKPVVAPPSSPATRGERPRETVPWEEEL